MTVKQKIVSKMPPSLPFSHRYNVSGLLAFHMHVIITEYSFISTLVPYNCANDSHYSFICSDHNDTDHYNYCHNDYQANIIINCSAAGIARLKMFKYYLKK